MIFQFGVFGVPLSIHWSTGILIAVLFFIALQHIKENVKGRSLRLYLLISFLCAVLLMMSVFFHEVGHALAYKFFGVDIVSAGVGGLMAYVEPDKSYLNLAPYMVLLSSAAGPVTNFLLALVAIPIIVLIKNPILKSSMKLFADLNIKIGLFNLMPVSNLDGGKILDSLVRIIFGEQMTRISNSIITIIVVIAVYSAFELCKKKVIKNYKTVEERLSAL